ncbi:MAG: hypothetical protein R3244_01455, partial [Thermoanaerobaculia bacterium]|nr:hypothetical protein [Thermoanaerobaculia bacterium]
MADTVRIAIEQKLDALLALVPEIVAATLVLALFALAGLALGAGLARALRATGRADRYVRLT